MIKISNLKKNYGSKEILFDINVDIKKQSIYGLIGISGAGKSTLLRCINGLETYEQGSLKVDGVEVKDLSEKQLREFRKDIGMIFQNFSLLERKTVYENIALPMECWSYSKSEIDAKVKTLLKLVDLEEKLDCKPRELSGGQKQRVAIARALALNPKILLCDEATSALDPNITNSILDLLKKINQELGITIIIVTHQMNVVKQICTDMAILSRGKISVKGKVEDIFLRKPKVMEELLGSYETYNIPQEGVIIEIIDKDKLNQTKLLSTLAIETGVKYSLVCGGMDKYRDRVISSFTIHIDEKDRKKVMEFLKDEKYEWREL